MSFRFLGINIFIKFAKQNIVKVIVKQLQLLCFYNCFFFAICL